MNNQILNSNSQTNGRIRVLIIEDSRFYRRVLSQILRQYPEFEIVGEADCGEQGLIQARKLNPDLITLDFEMPDMNGLETLKRLRQETDTPVVVVSGLLLQSDRRWEQFVALGVHEAVTKTISDTSLDVSLFEEELIKKIRITLAYKGHALLNIAR